MKRFTFATLSLMLFSSMALANTTMCYLLAKTPETFSRTPQKMCIEFLDELDQHKVTFSEGMWKPKVVAYAYLKQIRSARCLDCNEDVFESRGNFFITRFMNTLTPRSFMHELEALRGQHVTISFHGKRTLEHLPTPEHHVRIVGEAGTVQIEELSYAYQAIM